MIACNFQFKNTPNGVDMDNSAGFSGYKMELLKPRDIQRLQKAMASSTSESFFGALRNLLRARLFFDTFLILKFPSRGAPEPVATWIKDAVVAQNYPQLYTERAYRLDPFYQFGQRRSRTGLFRLSEIAPVRFFSSEYYTQYYRETGIVDEVGLLVPLSDGSIGHLSFSRREAVGPFRRKELQCLRQYSPILTELLRQHLEHRLNDSTNSIPERETRPLDALIRSYVKAKTGTAITQREGEMAALILQGHSNVSAALLMGISRETAKVHRRNIYRKLTISSQTELFALLAELF